MATVTIRPDSDNSVALSTFGGSGTNHWDKVDESTADNTDGVRTPAAAGAAIDRFGLPNLGLTGKINSVVVYSRMWSAATIYTYAAYRLLVRMGGTNYFSSAVALTTTATLYSNTWTTNPNTTAAWTWTNINDLIAGVELTPGAYDLKSGTLVLGSCSQFYVTIDYTPTGQILVTI